MIYELRHYTAKPGKEQALLDRFRRHVLPTFARIGFDLVTFWHEQKSLGDVWYVLRWESEAAKSEFWQRLREDDEWQQVKTASEKDGPLIDSIDSILLQCPTWVKSETNADSKSSD